MAPRVLTARRILFAACVVGVVFLAGCGGDSSSEDAGATRGDEASSSSWTVPSDEEMAELARQQIAKQQRALGAPAPAAGSGSGDDDEPAGSGRESRLPRRLRFRLRLFVLRRRLRQFRFRGRRVRC